MDLATVGALLVGVDTLTGGLLGWIGKRGENHTVRLNSTMDQIQEERDGLRAVVTERDAQIKGLLEQRLSDQVEIARLKVQVIELGGEP